MAKTNIRLGTRASALAQWQAEWVAARLRELGMEVEIVHVSTAGDRDQQTTAAATGGEGLFTKEIQTALLENRIDLAVHRLKDLPTEPVAGLSLAAVPTRAPVNDVLVNNHGWTLDTLPKAARVGTGSMRRKAQLLHARPDLHLLDIRGNVDTRLRKVDEGQYDAIVLAEAGISRLGLQARITQRLPTDVMMPAVGQGALGLETRSDDGAAQQAVQPLNDRATHLAVLAERTLLAALRAGCLAPVGAWARCQQPRMYLNAVVLSCDGQQRLTTSVEGQMGAPIQLGKLAAEELLRQGAAALIQAAK